MRLFKTEKRAENAAAESSVTADVLLAQILGGSEITADKALEIPAVSRCIEMIASAAAALPIKLYRRTADGVEEVREDTRLMLLNSRTGDTLDASQMRINWVYDYLLYGNAYAYINRDIYSKISGIYYVSPKAVSITANRTDPIHKLYDYNIGGRKYYPYQLLKILRHSDGYGKGRGIVSENKMILSVVYQLIKFQKSLMKKGGNKRGFLKTEKHLSEPAMEKLKESWRKLYSNEGDGILVLNEGMDFKEASSTNVEMQLNESIQTNNAEIMKLFGTSDGILSDATVKNAVMPVLDALEAAFDADLLTEAERENYYFAFDTRELTRGDIQSRYAAYSVALQNNFMQLDEVRALEDLPPLGVNFIKLGLNDVLLDPKTNRIYTPNTNAMVDLGTGRDVFAEVPADMELRYNKCHDGRGRFCSGRGSGRGMIFDDIENIGSSEKIGINELTKRYSNGGGGSEKSLTNIESGGKIIKSEDDYKNYDTSKINSTNVEISEHANERLAERGLTIENIIDAIDNPIGEKPIKTDKDGRPSFQRIGKNATVAINPENSKVTSMWKTHTKLRNKLEGK